MLRQTLIFLCSFCFSQLAWSANYTHPDRHLRLEYADKLWSLSKAAKGTAKLGNNPHSTLFALQRQNADKQYHPRFSIVVEDLSRFESLENYVQKSVVGFLKKQKFQKIVRSEIVLAKLKQEAIQITATHHDFGISYRQVVFQRGNEAFLVTAASRPETFSTYDPEWTEMIQSLSFGK